MTCVFFCGVGRKGHGNGRSNSNSKRNDNSNGNSNGNSRSVRLRCSQSAVSNFAQDDMVFLAGEENRQRQRQRQISAG
jgi:hypothetical protein